MNIKEFYADPNEKPLDRLLPDGGFCGIFRTIACIGDSLSSGEFESYNSAEEKKGYHDYYEYSWGQYIARMTGSTVYNFSKGGMTAKQYWDSFAESRGFWDEEKLCRAYIMALGVNDVFNKTDPPMGSADDVCLEDYTKNAETVIGYYARIIQRLKTMQPKARFFLVTMPRGIDEVKNKKAELFREQIYRLAEMFDYTYVIDLYQYAPIYDEEFRNNFYLGNHLNAAGYMLTAKMIASYIDYIIRNNPDDFTQIGFVGTPHYNDKYKW